MFFEDLPDAFDGYQITQISDIHSGSFDNKDKIEYAVDLVNEQASDVIMFTGDLVNSRSEEMRPWKSTFSKLKAIDGVFSILGNHDYGHDWSDQYVANNITSILENAGVKILGNDKFNFNGLHIIGLDDFWGLNFDPKKIMNKHNSENANLVLCHNPDVCDLDVWNNYRGWILAGHTHGGQVKPPCIYGNTSNKRKNREFIW